MWEKRGKGIESFRYNPTTGEATPIFIRKIQGDENMETKSRYEVIADLEANKRKLIRERDELPLEVQRRQLEIKLQKRTLEDLEEDLKNFKDGLDVKKETINELIKTVEQSLERLSTLNSQKK